VPKQTEEQQEIIEDVMHDFKKGTLKSSSGDKVTNRKQAKAIGLSEAGASKSKDKKQNARTLKRTLAKKKKNN